MTALRWSRRHKRDFWRSFCACGTCSREKGTLKGGSGLDAGLLRVKTRLSIAAACRSAYPSTPDAIALSICQAYPPFAVVRPSKESAVAFDWHA